MRKTSLSATIVLTLLPLAAAAAWAETARFTPPSEPGTIFTVIDFVRSEGVVQPTSVTVIRGTSRKTKIVIPPYRHCDTTFPAGFVLKIRNPRTNAPQMTLKTNGDIVRGPYQGELPLEVLHSCYKLVLF
ncbi:MAG TPA: hypothetical protein VGX68_11535 [Thermoanaerobaculia bacterium]|jgi:hypothetical protein|nr:hypothetical protein [Thermoanaerobaculia bacterium]